MYLLVRLRVEEEPRLESRPRWPVGEVTDEEVVVVVVGVEVLEELKSSCLRPKEPLEDKMSDKHIRVTSEPERDTNTGMLIAIS